MRVALDTNRLTDLFRGDEALAKQLAACEEVYIPLLVLAELLAGIYGGTRQSHNQARLRGLLMKPTVSILSPGRETAEHYARIFLQLKLAGTPIPDNDLWIAALTLEHDLHLITRDRHFQKIPQLSTG